jgi:hypothetical protein
MRTRFMHAGALVMASRVCRVEIKHLRYRQRIHPPQGSSTCRYAAVATSVILAELVSDRQQYRAGC